MEQISAKKTMQNAPKQYLHYLISPIFQGVNRLFILVCNANDNKIGHSRQYLPTEKIDDVEVEVEKEKVEVET